MFKNFTTKTIALVVTAVFTASLIPIPTYAAIYEPGATLDPGCLPTDANCGVSTSTNSIIGSQGQLVTFNASGTPTATSTLFISPTTGNIVIGTSTSPAVLEVIGSITSKGTSWTAYTAASNAQWRSIAYGNGIFVAGAQNGSIMTSLDGINWTSQTAVSASPWTSITYGGGIFLALSASSTAMVSRDGSTWTARTIAPAGFTPAWTSAAYGNGMFVAVASGGNTFISRNVKDWTTGSGNRLAYMSIAYGGGAFVGVGSEAGVGYIDRSTDGNDPVLISSAFPSNFPNLWTSVTYGNGMFVAVASDGAVITSSDTGNNWTYRTAASASPWSSVTFGNGMFIAVATNGGIMTSPDGITWAARTSPVVGQNWSAVTYGNGAFVAVPNGGGSVMTSGKGETAPLSYGNSLIGDLSLLGGYLGIGTASPIDELHIAGFANPDTIGTTSAPTLPQGIHVQGRYAYVISKTTSQLSIYDISNPAAMTQKSTLVLPGTPFDLTVSGRYAYVIDNGSSNFSIVDVGNPAAPVKISTINPGGNSYSISVQGKYAYIVTASGFRIYDISNPALPVLVSAPGGSSAGGIVVQGRYAYLAESSNTLAVYDVSNPANPVRMGTNSTSLSLPYSLYVQGDYAYVTNLGSGGNGKLSIFNISDPASPVFVSSVTPNSVGSYYRVYVQGRYAYVTVYKSSDGTGAIDVYDISNPASPTEISNSTESSMRPFDIAVQGRYAFYTNGTNNSLVALQVGGAYVQSLEAGTLQASSLQLDSNLQGLDGTFLGGLTVAHGLNVGGSFNLTAASFNAVSTSTQNHAIFSVGSASSTIPFLSVLYNSSVGIGTSSPARKLHVFTSADEAPVRFQDASGYCEIDPTSTSWTCTSDASLKTNIMTIDNTLDGVLGLNIVNFDWKNSASTTEGARGKQYGLIAQDVEKIFPHLVNTDRETGLKSVAYGGLSVLMIKAMQDQYSGLIGVDTSKTTNIDSIFSSTTTLDALLQGSVPLQTEYSDPIAYMGTLVGGGIKVVRSLVAETMVAVRGYFTELFAERYCGTADDGSTYCLTGDDIKALGGMRLEKDTIDEGVTDQTQIDNTGDTSTVTSTDSANSPQAVTITINGESPAEVEVGADYVDAGAAAVDTATTTPVIVRTYQLIGGELTEVSSVTLDTATSSTQKITYRVLDDVGNILAEATRTVQVIDATQGAGVLVCTAPQVLNTEENECIDPDSEPIAPASVSVVEEPKVDEPVINDVD